MKDQSWFVSKREQLLEEIPILTTKKNQALFDSEIETIQDILNPVKLLEFQRLENELDYQKTILHFIESEVLA